MKYLWLAALAAALLLSGCMPDQKIDFASCRLEALRVYPTEPESTKRAHLFVGLCKTSKAYETRGLDVRCDDKTLYFEQLYCWAPTGWFGRNVRRMELALGLAD
jgi:hypothetical protein